jgi:NAD(P)-dependent dehydrogenase (short-subunit alcohol dehydrogenase family)
MTTTSKRVFLVTGANAGLGFKASLDLAHQPNAHVIMTGRSLERVEAAADRVRAAVVEADPTASSTVETALLDLSSLDSVRKFCASLQARSPPLTDLTILCNAGVSIPKKTLTADGFELTFGVNHLGHFLLVTTLLPITERIVVVSSEVHNPPPNAPFPQPNVSDLDQMSLGYEPYNGGEAYATSKLCNLLFMNEFIRRFPAGPEILAYSPGFTPDTEFGRNRDTHGINSVRILEMCKQYGIPISTTEVSGAFMAELCAESDWNARGWATGMFYCVDQPYHTSELAKDSKLAMELWVFSERLAGVKQE